MKDVRIGGHKVRIYTDIDELPMVRFHKYNRMLLVDAGVGSDISDFDAHIERVVRYIRGGKNDEAAKELENLRQNVYMILSGQSPKDLSFACLVASIDGKATDDLSDDGLRRVVAMLSDGTKKEASDRLSEAKKKIDEQLMAYFPAVFDDVEVREYYDLMKRRTVAMLENIIKGESDERNKAIEQMTERMVLYMKPKVFTGTGSVEIQHDKAYESLCLTIQKETGADPKRMTVLEYYNAYEYIRKIAKEKARKDRK